MASSRLLSRVVDRNYHMGCHCLEMTMGREGVSPRGSNPAWGQSGGAEVWLPPPSLTSGEAVVAVAAAERELMAFREKRGKKMTLEEKAWE